MSKKRRTEESAAFFTKKSRKTLTLEAKLEVLRRLSAGEKIADVGRTLNLQRTTVHTIKKNAEKIRASAQVASSQSCTAITKSRSANMERMENLLNIWIENLNEKNVPLSMLLIQEQAKAIFNSLVNQNGAESAAESFSASRGWFHRFKCRSRLNYIKLKGDSTIGDTEAAQKFLATLANIISEGEYVAQQVFNVDETSLFWKRMPSKTFLSKEETTTPGFKDSKDRLTLLLGGNASGDFKLKPLLIYSSETPKAMKNTPKEKLPVIWRSNKKSWMTSVIFHDWFKNYFCPAVKDYCLQNELPYKALLILDNAPSHTANLNNLDENIKVIILPPNTTSLLQPMSQGLIESFKAYYLRRTFYQMIQEIDYGDGDYGKSTIRNFWRNFNIMEAIENIHESWKELKTSNMNTAWLVLWPECLNWDADPIEMSGIRAEILNLAHQIGLTEIDDMNLIELLDSHNEEMSTEELIQLLPAPPIDIEAKSEARVIKEKLIWDSCPLTHHKLAEGFKCLDEATAIFNLDLDKKRNERFVQNLADAVLSYKELYAEKKADAAQPKIYQFFKKICPQATGLIPSTVTASDEESMDGSEIIERRLKNPKLKTSRSDEI